MSTFNEFVTQNFGDNSNATYLGDGAYAGFTGYSYIIFTSNGESVENQVHLEAPAIRTFNHFIDQMDTKHGT